MLFADFPNSKFWFPEFVSSYAWHVIYYLYKKCFLFITGGAHIFGFISNFSVYLQVIDEDHSPTNEKLSDVVNYFVWVYQFIPNILRPFNTVAKFKFRFFLDVVCLL